MKKDYPKLQQEYWEKARQDPSYTVKQFCEDNELKYTAVRRHIKKLPTEKDKQTVKTGTSKGNIEPKIKPVTTSHGNDWHSMLKEYLALAIKNPTLTMAAYAKHKNVNGATLRRQFNSMRNNEIFVPLFDLYEEQQRKYKDAKRYKGNTKADKTTSSNAKAGTHAPDLYRNKDKIGTKKRSNDHVQIDDDVMVYVSTKVGRPVIHGGYAKSVGLTSEIMDLIMQIDPLSIGNELVMARAQYFRMQTTLSKRIAEIDEMELSGELPVDDDDNPLDANKLRDSLIFGYAPRLRELEFSISSMVKQEQKRYIDLRKQEYDEMMRPHLLPAAETEIVIEMLTLRARNNWTALETCHQIELMGARPSQTVLHEAKLELAALEPEVDDSGVSEEELDSMFENYNHQQSEFSDEWLAARREEVATKIKEAEDKEDGIAPELSADEIKKEAQAEQEYDELAERERAQASVFDDLDSFEVL